jgi:hypothetical protein
VAGVGVGVAGVEVGVGVAGDGVGVVAGPQGVNGPTATVNCVPPREVSALLFPVAPEPAVVNVLPRSPTRMEPGTING